MKWQVRHQFCENQHEFYFDSRISTFWLLNKTTCTTVWRYESHLFHCELVNVHCKFPVCQSQDDAGGLGRLCLYLSWGLQVQMNDTHFIRYPHFTIIWIFVKSCWDVIGFIWEGKLTSFIPSCIYVSPAGFTSRRRFRPSSISYLKTQNKWLTFCFTCALHADIISGFQVCLFFSHCGWRFLSYRCKNSMLTPHW